MPQVKMLVSLAGQEINYMPGDLIELSDEHAAAWIKDGLAAPIETAPEQKKEKK